MSERAARWLIGAVEVDLAALERDGQQDGHTHELLKEQLARLRAKYPE